ncbi:MAG: hypothetical protein K1X53_09570 [Candidatus Sumerlaeaceae bacterium]|nr:hypothetical protein [Candidatus Sumerlaeaceae bacterium]
MNPPVVAATVAAAESPSGRLIWVILIGFAVLIAGLLAGYRAWRRKETALKNLPPDAPLARLFAIPAASPIAVGTTVGLLLLAILSSRVVAGDRYYTPSAAAWMAIGIICGILVLLFGKTFGTMASLLVQLPTDRPPTAKEAASVKVPGRGFGIFIELLAALIAVWAGVRFNVLSLGSEHTYVLGGWTIPLTVLWIFAATNIVKLLDGLQGAANVLLLLAGISIHYFTFGVPEYFLNALSVIIIAAAIASLRFNFYPARLALTGPGIALAGFLFAILTVLARQKTVTALLLIFPMIVVIILVGGAMLGMLERQMAPENDEKK